MNRGWTGEQQGKFHYKQVSTLQKCAKWNNSKVLDLGCGIGRLSQEFFNLGAKEVVGVDLSSEMVKLAKTNVKHGVFKRMDLKGDWSVLNGETFDIIYSGSVFIHIMSDKIVEDSYGKVYIRLRDGGTAIFVHEIGDERNVLGDYCVVRTKEYYDKCATWAGFRIVARVTFEFGGNTYYFQSLGV